MLTQVQFSNSGTSKLPCQFSFLKTATHFLPSMFWLENMPSGFLLIQGRNQRNFLLAFYLFFLCTLSIPTFFFLLSLFLFYTHFLKTFNIVSQYQDGYVFHLTIHMLPTSISTLEFLDNGFFMTWLRKFLSVFEGCLVFFLTGWLLHVYCTFIRDALNGTKTDIEQARADSFTPVTAA